MNKIVVTYLIKQEFRYVQLIAGLRNLTFESNHYIISLLEAIQPLMGVPVSEDGSLPQISDDLSATYYEYLTKAEQYDFAITDKEFDQLAESCFNSLALIIHNERKQKYLSKPNGLVEYIKSQLTYKDRRAIALVVGCSAELVRKVLTGHRGYKRGKGKQIVEVAEKIVETREQLRRLRP